MNNSLDRRETRRSELLEQLPWLARQISDAFLSARDASLPTSTLAAEVGRAMEEAFENGVEQPLDTIRFRFAQIFRRRLGELWHRSWPGLPEFWSDVEPTAGWHGAVLAALARHRCIAPVARAIPVYDTQAAADRTLKVNYDRPAGWHTVTCQIDLGRAIYGIQIPRALASAAVGWGKLALLDASPAEAWRPPSGGTAALIAVSPLPSPSTIVQWFGHLDSLDQAAATVRQSAESTVSCEIFRKGTVIHPVIHIADYPAAD